MSEIRITDHDGPVPMPRELAIEANDAGKREALAELALCQERIDGIERGEMAGALGFGWYWERRLERAKAALADAPGGERCKR